MIAKCLQLSGSSTGVFAAVRRVSPPPVSKAFPETPLYAAALYENGRVTKLPMPPGWTSAEAFDINDNNQIVGWTDSYPTTHNDGYGVWLWTKAG